MYNLVDKIDERSGPDTLVNSQELSAVFSPTSNTQIPLSTGRHTHQNNQDGATLPVRQLNDMITSATHREAPVRPMTQENNRRGGRRQ